jgi:hypothetical protein
MPSPRTPEEEYDWILGTAWETFVRGDARRMTSLARLLERANGAISAAILNAADEAGNVPLERMEQLRARIAAAMGAFRTAYQNALDTQIQSAAREATAARLAALDAYAGPAAVRLEARLNETTPAVLEAMRARTLNGLNLSERIWRLDRGSRLLLQQEILNTIQAGRGAAEMARRVSQYLLPGQELPRGNVPSAVYSGQPLSVSYNAYRLARTEINQTYHAAQQAHDDTMVGAGLALGTRWKLSSEHGARMLKATQGKTARDICDQWAARLPGGEVLKGQPTPSAAAEQQLLAQLTKYGLAPQGVYVAGKAPTDHPNGLCTEQTVLKPREALMAEGII